MSDEIGDLNFDSVPETTLLVTPCDNAAVNDDGDFVLEKVDHARATTPREGAAPGSDPNARTASGGRIGSFRISREIGRGGMGVVYEATEEILNRRVALKVLPLAALMDEQQIRRFRNEAAAAAQLIHPHIVPVYSVGSDRGVHFYAMQLIEGQNIAQVICSIRDRLSSEQQKKQNPTPRAAGTTQHSDESPGPVQKEGKVQSHASSGRHLMEDDFAAAVSGRRQPLHSQRLFKTVAALGRDAALAIGHAHDHGIIHRDIKPSNLLLDEKGKIWITDFGLAQIRDNPGETRTGDIVGTLRYMSPEQASGRKFLVDHRTDIYSLGITLYELLTLKQAFNGKGTKEILRQVAFEDPIALRQVNPRIPAELEVIISKAIGKNPQERYATAPELAEDLERFCNDQPIAAKPPSRVQRFRRWMSKHQTLSGMIGVGLGIVFLSSVAMSAVIWNSWQQETAQRRKVTELLDRSEGLRLIANSSLTLTENPGLALALALEGSKQVSGLEANKAVQTAIDANHELRVVFPREQISGTVNIDSRGQTVVSCVSRDKFGTGSFPAIMTDLRSGAESGRLDSGHAITSAVFSPPGDLILTASCGMQHGGSSGWDPAKIGAPALWDVSTGRQLTAYSQHLLVEACPEMFSPDGKSVVVPGPENDATVYQTGTANHGFALRGHSQPVIQAVFSADGTLIATADIHGEVRVWNAGDGKLVQSLQGGESRQRGNSLFLTHDSQSVVFASDEGTRRIPVGGAAATTPGFWREPICVRSLHNRGACFWSGGHRVLIRDLRSGTVVCDIPAPAGIDTAAFSRDGRLLAVSAGNTIQVHDTGTGASVFELRGHSGIVNSIAWEKSGNQLVTASHDKSLRLWATQSGAERRRFDAVSDGQASGNVAFSSDGTLMLAASTSRMQTQLLDASGQRLTGTMAGEVLSDVFEAALLPVVTGKTVSVYESATSRVLQTRTFAGESVHAVVTVPGSTSMIVCSVGSQSVLWNVDTDEVRPLTVLGDAAMSWEVSDDGSRFLLGTKDGRCQLHDSKSGERLRSVDHTSVVTAVRFMADLNNFVTVDERNTVRFWGADDEIPEKLLRQDGLVFNNCFLSPDRRFLVTFHEDDAAHPVSCWDAATGEILRQTPGETGLKVLRHPTQPVVALASNAAGLKTWNFETDELKDLSPIPTMDAVLLNDRLFAVQAPPEPDQSGIKFATVPHTTVSILRVFVADTGEVVFESPAAGEPYLKKLAADPTGNRAVVTSEVYSASVCELQARRTVSCVGAHNAPISFSHFIGHTGQIVTTSWDGTTRIWSDGFRLLHTLGKGSQPVTSAALTPDGRTLACGHLDGEIVFWNTATGEKLLTLNSPAGPIQSMVFDASGQNLVSAQAKGNVKLWNLLSREFKEIAVQTDICAARISFNDQYILIIPIRDPFIPKSEAVPNPKAVLWEITTGKSFDLPDAGSVRAGSFAFKSNRCVLVGEDGSATLVDIGQDGRVTVFKRLVSKIGRFLNSAFSPDDTMLAMRHENRISLWDTNSGHEMHRIISLRPGGFVSGNPRKAEAWTPFSPDGLRFGATGLETMFANVAPAVAANSMRLLFPFERDQFSSEVALQTE